MDVRGASKHTLQRPYSVSMALWTFFAYHVDRKDAIKHRYDNDPLLTVNIRVKIYSKLCKHDSAPMKSAQRMNLIFLKAERCFMIAETHLNE